MKRGDYERRIEFYSLIQRYIENNRIEQDATI